MRLKQTFETECYISEGGYYVIKQENPGEDLDSTILLSPLQVESLIKHMQESMMDTSWWYKEDDF